MQQHNAGLLGTKMEIPDQIDFRNRERENENKLYLSLSFLPVTLQENAPKSLDHSSGRLGACSGGVAGGSGVYPHLDVPPAVYDCAGFQRTGGSSGHPG